MGNRGTCKNISLQMFFVNVIVTWKGNNSQNRFLYVMFFVDDGTEKFYALCCFFFPDVRPLFNARSDKIELVCTQSGPYSAKGRVSAF